MKPTFPILLTLLLTLLIPPALGLHPLAGLREVHPRLSLSHERINEIRGLIKNHDGAKAVYKHLINRAEDILDEPLVKYEIPDGKRLLRQSRRALDRVTLFSLLYRLDGTEKYLERAKQELFAAAKFKDWNPSHFLDTAEMSNAFGIGYDWLYHELTPEERETLRTALIEKGLKAYLKGWENGAWWTRATHNWNQVCHGGCGVGALAIADEAPELAREVLQKAIDTLPKALQHYGPDGGWNEGPGYWHYATRYTVYFLSACETALGRDFGLSEIEGFDKAGDFRIHFVGPTGQTFNYADAGSGNPDTHEMFWLAKRFDKPYYAFYQRENLGTPNAYDLIWYNTDGDAELLYSQPASAYFRNVEVAFLRSEWNHPKALFAGFKGGDNQANHGHLDLGSFVLDAGGMRWAVDLGSDNYNLPGYFGGKRWDYFRNNTFSHNTLILNESNQNPQAESKIIAFNNKKNRTHAIADLTEAYIEHASKVHRGIAMINNSYIVVQDEITTKDEAVDVRWNLMTGAEAIIDADNRGAVLMDLDRGQRLRLDILLPKEGIDVELYTANPPEPQKPNPGKQRVTLFMPDVQGETRIVVALKPMGEEWETPEASEIAVQPLSQW